MCSLFHTCKHILIRLIVLVLLDRKEEFSDKRALYRSETFLLLVNNVPPRGDILIMHWEKITVLYSKPLIACHR